jgi:hypothetical protein
MQQASPSESTSLATTFVEMIVAPRRALQRVARRQTQSWWLPVLLALGASILYLWLNLGRTAALAARQLELQLSTLPPDQVEAARAMAERFSQPRTMLIMGVFSTALGLAVGLLLGSAILYFGAALFGAMPKFNQIWPAFAWTWLPFVFRSFLQAAWSTINQALITYPGLSYLVATGDTLADNKNWTFVALSQIDLFSLWHVLLVYLLLRVVTRLGGGSAFVLTLLYAVLTLGLHLLPVLAGGLVSFGG